MKRLLQVFRNQLSAGLLTIVLGSAAATSAVVETVDDTRNGLTNPNAIDIHDISEISDLQADAKLPVEIRLDDKTTGESMAELTVGGVLIGAGALMRRRHAQWLADRSDGTSRRAVEGDVSGFKLVDKYRSIDFPQLDRSLYPDLYRALTSHSDSPEGLAGPTESPPNAPSQMDIAKEFARAFDGVMPGIQWISERLWQLYADRHGIDTENGRNIFRVMKFKAVGERIEVRVAVVPSLISTPQQEKAMEVFLDKLKDLFEEKLVACVMHLLKDRLDIEATSGELDNTQRRSPGVDGFIKAIFDEMEMGDDEFLEAIRAGKARLDLVLNVDGKLSPNNDPT
ncbi:MAG: hypothetical protein AAFX76_06090 [Planctomycetota bacterium]